MARRLSATDIDVTAVVDDLPIGRFHIVLLIACALLALSDGYSVASPSPKDSPVLPWCAEWKIANLGTLAPVFGAADFSAFSSGHRCLDFLAIVWAESPR